MFSNLSRIVCLYLLGLLCLLLPATNVDVSAWIQYGLVATGLILTTGVTAALIIDSRAEKFTGHEHYNY